MPLTLSHPAAVLPLRRLGLPTTALVAGSMAPDLPLFLGWTHGYAFSHSVAGVATADAAVALLAVWSWFTVVRDPLVDLAPGVIRTRLDASVSLTSRQWVLVVPAAWVGATTHVLWDEFTHRGRWGVERWLWLQEVHAGLPGHRWVQYVSGVLGFAVVCLAAASHLRRLPRRPRPEPRPAWAAAALMAATAAVVVTVVVTVAVHTSSGLHAMAFNAAVSGIITAAACLATLALGWHLTRRAARWSP